MGDKYITINDFSKFTGYKVRTVRGLIKSGKIKNCKKTVSGYRWMIGTDEVERLNKDDNKD